jgi:phage terminase large subunit GpA-like protein
VNRDAHSLQRTVDLFDEVCKILAPPEPITVTEWADKFRYLPAEAAAEPGKYSSKRTPFAREIMNAVGDRHTRRVVVKASSQVCKTEIILNAIGYFSTVDPCPILWVLPREDDAKSFSTERLAPSIRDTPAMREVFSDPNDRKKNKVLHKSFRGGFVAMVSSEVPAALSGRPIRVLLMDEIDRFPESSGKEGDPCEIAGRRTTTFWNKKEILTSSPTIEGSSRIDAAYKESTQESWFVPCPDQDCKHMQTLSFWRLDFATLKHKCEKCEECFDQVEWQAQNLQGRWIAAREHDRHGRKLTTRGFHLSSMVSPFAQWSEMVTKYLEAKRLSDAGDVNKLITFHNTWLGDCWKEKFDGIEKEDLYARREEYPAELPDQVVYLTCGVDTQDHRLEATVYGWSKGHECFGIEHVRIYGDTSGEDIWRELDKFLGKVFAYSDGYKRQIDKVFVDSGGHSTQQVYKFCRYKTPRIFASKGSSVAGSPIIKVVTKTSQTRQPLVIIGTDTAKSELLLRLNVQHPGPGFVHFPRLPDGNPAKGFDSEFFRALTSETQKAKFVNGMRKVFWEKNSYDPNESWDCFVYARAALTHSENQALRLDEIDRPRFNEEPKKKPQFGVYDPTKNPTPQQLSPTRTESTQQTGSVPRWLQNRRQQNRDFDPRDF